MKLLVLIAGLCFLSLNVKAQPVTEICVATVDSTYTHNVIVWQKADQISTAAIDSMRIYQVDVTGMPILIATVDYDSLSEYHDYSASVDIMPYTYRIQGVDVNGAAGSLSLPHTTIHFTVIDDQSGSLHLDWTPYVGHPVPGYDCWRDSMGFTNFELVNTTSNGNTTDWWDNNPPVGMSNLWYRVDVPWNISCESTRANQNTTRSNKTQPGLNGGGGVGINEKTLHAFEVFPNPSSGEFYYQFSSTSWDPVSIDVINLSGEKVVSTQYLKISGQYRSRLNLEGVSSGIYLLRIGNSSQTISKKLIVQ